MVTFVGVTFVGFQLYPKAELRRRVLERWCRGQRDREVASRVPKVLPLHVLALGQSLPESLCESLCRSLRRVRNVPFTRSCVLYMYGGNRLFTQRVCLFLCSSLLGAVPTFSVESMCGYFLSLFVFLVCCIFFDMLDTRPHGFKVFVVVFFFMQGYCFLPSVGEMWTFDPYVRYDSIFSTLSEAGLSSCDSHSRSRSLIVVLYLYFYILCCVPVGVCLLLQGTKG